MIRTEDDLRAVYTDAPAGLAEAEARVLDALTTQPLADTNHRRVPRRAWLAAAASAAAVIAVVVAAGAVVGHRAHSTQPGTAPTIPGPYRHTRVHETQTGNVVPKDTVTEVWMASDGHSWTRGTDDGTTAYGYRASDLKSTRYEWSFGYLAALPTNPDKLRQQLLRGGTYVYGENVDDQKAVNLMATVSVGFWKGEGYRFVSPAALRAIVRMLEATKGVATHQVQDPLGRSALRFDAHVRGEEYSVLFDAKTSGYLGSDYQSKGESSQIVVEVDDLTNTIPATVADQARKTNASLRSLGTPWVQPVTG